MAYFRSKFQIPGLIPIKEHGYYSQLLKNPSAVRCVVEQNIRHFWFRRSKESQTENELEGGTGNCGKPPPPPPPIGPLPCCSSKCLEKGYGEPITQDKSKRRSFGFRKKSEKKPVIKQKPSNCVEVKPPSKPKLTLWEQLFGPDPKRSWPDPCTCRLAYQQRKKCRQEDPRLQDPRYQSTQGDVLLYTEHPRGFRRSCMEPQPKPPPSFKMPKAVLCRMIAESPEKMSSKSCADGEQDDNCKDSWAMLMQPRIPFEEMRPPERKRKIFSCREGVKPEDVIKPFAKESNPYGVPFQNYMVKSNSQSSEKTVDVKQKSKVKDNLERKVPKRSRIEQLKVLIEERNTSECISSFFK